MPLAIRTSDEAAPALSALPTLTVRRERDPARMAALQNRAVDEMARRFAAGHRAYVAYDGGEPAAWGWVATRTADLGELGATFVVGAGERYLWNFVTLASHRGRGIYPRLLDAIVRAESRGVSPARRFWIAYAPENHASGAGIRKAGFVDVAELSFDASGRAAIEARADGALADATRVLGLPVSDGSLAQCWRCARSAPRRAMSCAEGTCRCDYQRPESGCAA